MNVKLSTILEAKRALELISYKDLNMKSAHKIANLLKAIHAEIKAYDEQRIKLLESVGSVLSEDGTHYDIPSDKRKEFEAQITELVSAEVKLPDKIHITEEFNLSAEMIISLEPFIVFEAE